MIEICYQPDDVINYFFSRHKLNLICEIALVNRASFAELTLIGYLRLFALTVLLETPVYWIVLGGTKKQLARFIKAILTVNVATHPAVSFLFAHFASRHGWSEIQYITLAEGFAFVAEALILGVYFKYSWWRAIVGAFLANLASWWLGSFLV